MARKPGIEAAIVPQVSRRWQPTGKAVAAPPGVPGPTAAPSGLEPAPDVFASWRTFTAALGTHLPNSLTRAQDLRRAMRSAVR